MTNRTDSEPRAQARSSGGQLSALREYYDNAERQFRECWLWIGRPAKEGERVWEGVQRVVEDRDELRARVALLAIRIERLVAAGGLLRLELQEWMDQDIEQFGTAESCDIDAIAAWDAAIANTDD